MFPWFSFLTYMIIVAITPGPNNIMSMNNAKNVGFKKGVQFNFGIFTGLFVVIILCLIFSAFLYNLVPRIQFPMKILGAAYMTYLVVKILVPSKTKKDRNSNGSYIMGVLLQFINPKLMIYGLTSMSTFILPYYSEIPIQVFFAFLLAFAGFISTLLWALFGSLFSMLFDRHGKILNITMTLLLVYCIVSLFL